MTFDHTVHNINDFHQLQNDISRLERWAKTWQMEFNPSKCEFLKITNKRLSLLFKLHIILLSNYISYQYEPIKDVQHAKYLTLI